VGQRKSLYDKHFCRKCLITQKLDFGLDVLWEQEVAGSNPVAPIHKPLQNKGLYFLLDKPKSLIYVLQPQRVVFLEIDL